MTRSPDEATSVTDKDPAANGSAKEVLQGQERYPSQGVNWNWMVSHIRMGDEVAMAELYQIFARGIRFYLCRQLGPQELDDKVHDTFVIVVQAIRRGELRDPERLMGFVRTIVRRQVAAYIEEAVHRRREQAEADTCVRLIDHGSTPEQTAMDQQRREFVDSVMNRMSSRDREILTRFYIDEQDQDQICEEMSLTETQFRLLKSRAKARFGEIGKKKLQRPIVGLFVRASASAGH